MLLPLPYSSMFITMASIHLLRVMYLSGSMSILRDSSLMMRVSPWSVCFIRWMVIIPTRLAIM